MVAPIALYPGSVTEPDPGSVDLSAGAVEASQWLGRNPGLAGAGLTQAAQQQNWDPSIQALVVFPDLVKRLNQDITWTTNLGNAFLGQQADVMDAVQRMRLKAQQAGKLSSTSQETVTTTSDSGQAVIQIEPVIRRSSTCRITIPRTSGGHLCTIRMRVGITLRATTASVSGIPMGSYFGGGWAGWGGWGWQSRLGRPQHYVNNSFVHRYNFNSEAAPV